MVALPPEGSYLVTGPPGSGKTNLALLRARYLNLKERDDVVVLTMGRVISEFIIDGAMDHDVDEHKIMTFHRWGRERLLEAGEDVDFLHGSAPYETKTAVLTERLLELGRNNRIPRHDALIIDEAQDYPSGAPELFSLAARELFVTGDERQRVYSANSSTLSEFASVVQERIDLRYHYRNGRAICAVAGRIADQDYLSTSRYDEDETPSSVSPIVAAPLADQVDQAVEAIETQLEAYPGELIGVMVPLNRDLDEVVERLEESTIGEFCQYQSSRQGYARLDPERRIIVTTVHGSKGLEFRCAHLIAADGLNQYGAARRRNLGFTAVTRAKTSLSVYRDEAAPGWLESAVHAAERINRAEREIPIEQLF